MNFLPLGSSAVESLHRARHNEGLNKKCLLRQKQLILQNKEASHPEVIVSYNLVMPADLVNNYLTYILGEVHDALGRSYTLV